MPRPLFVLRPITDPPHARSLGLLISIAAYRERQGWWPTIRELIEPLTGLRSTSLVAYRLHELRARGWLVTPPGPQSDRGQAVLDRTRVAVAHIYGEAFACEILKAVLA